jgi:hypothetical protein
MPFPGAIPIDVPTFNPHFQEGENKVPQFEAEQAAGMTFPDTSETQWGNLEEGKQALRDALQRNQPAPNALVETLASAIQRGHDPADIQRLATTGITPGTFEDWVALRMQHEQEQQGQPLAPDQGQAIYDTMRQLAYAPVGGEQPTQPFQPDQYHGVAASNILDLMRPGTVTQAWLQQNLAPAMEAVSPRAAQNMRENARQMMETRGNVNLSNYVDPNSTLGEVAQGVVRAPGQLGSAVLSYANPLVAAGEAAMGSHLESQIANQQGANIGAGQQLLRAGGSALLNALVAKFFGSAPEATLKKMVAQELIGQGVPQAIADRTAMSLVVSGALTTQGAAENLLNQRSITSGLAPQAILGAALPHVMEAAGKGVEALRGKPIETPPPETTTAAPTPAARDRQEATPIAEAAKPPEAPAAQPEAAQPLLTTEEAVKRGLLPSDALAPKAEAPPEVPAQVPKSKGKPFSRADVERKLVERWTQEEGVNERQQTIDTANEAGNTTTFYNKNAPANPTSVMGLNYLAMLPGEVRDFLQGRANLRKKFFITSDASRTGGEDAMQANPNYFDDIEHGGQSKAKAAVEWGRNHPDPQIQLLAAIHDNMPAAKDRGKQEVIDPSQQPAGTKFTLFGKHEFEIVNDPAGGSRLLKDGEDFPVLPADMLDKMPIDRGSLTTGSKVSEVEGQQRMFQREPGADVGEALPTDQGGELPSFRPGEAGPEGPAGPTRTSSVTQAELSKTMPGAKLVKNPPKWIADAADAVSDNLGLEIVHANMPGAAGMVDPANPRRVYMDPRRPLEAWKIAFGHEFGHVLQGVSPEAEQAFFDSIPEKAKAKYRAEYEAAYKRAGFVEKYGPLSVEQLRREISAEAFKDAATRRKVQLAMSGKDPTLWDKVVEVWESIKDKVTGKSSLIDSALKALEAAHPILRENAPRLGGVIGKTLGKAAGEQVASSSPSTPKPGKAEDSEPSPTSTEKPAEEGEKSPTSIKNETVDAERLKRGLPAAMETAKRSFGEVWDTAMRKIDENPSIQDNLIDELKRRPRALTDVEDALLLHRQVDLQNQSAQVNDRLIEANKSGDQADISENRVRRAELSNRLLDIYNVGKSAGAETGRGLAARKMMANEDFSLARMETNRRAANGGKELTDAQRTEIEQLHQKLKQAQLVLDTHVRASQAKVQELEARVAAAEKGGKIAGKSTDKSILRSASNLGDRWMKEAAKALKEKGIGSTSRLFAGMDPTIYAHTVKYAAGWILKNGGAALVKAADFANHIKEEFGDQLKDYPIDKIWMDARSMAESQTQKPGKLDGVGEQLAAKVERAKQTIQQADARDAMKGRTLWEKTQDTFVKWRRAFVLSSPVTLAKLTSAALERKAFTPVEELVGGAISKVVPGLAAKAPREGGFSVTAEAKAITDGFTKGMSDAWQTLKTGKSDLDVLYGTHNGIPRDGVEFIGATHGALKASTKRNEFARSFQKRVEFELRNGGDPNDPVTQSRMALDAYKDANRSIFLNDNRVVDAYRRGISALKQPDKVTGHPSVGGKAVATVAETLLPIVRVPTNIVAETMQYALGSVSGSVRLAKAYYDGINKLAPDQADSIMRQLKKGTVGAAVMALGYWGANSIGGYYEPGKRDDKDVKFGKVRVFGHDIPSYLVHNPLLECLQIGATVRRVMDSRTKMGGVAGEKKGLLEGVAAAALGLVDEVPFVREMEETGKVLDPRQRDRALGQTAASIVTPAASTWTARQLDEDAQGEPIKRKPTGLTQQLEMGIPGLRQRVPIDEEAAKQKIHDEIVAAAKAGDPHQVLQDARDFGKIKPSEIPTLKKQINASSELVYKFENASMKTALEVWDTLSAAEKEEVRPTMRAKLRNSKLPHSEKQAIYDKINK